MGIENEVCVRRAVLGGVHATLGCGHPLLKRERNNSLRRVSVYKGVHPRGQKWKFHLACHATRAHFADGFRSARAKLQGRCTLPNQSFSQLGDEP
jgi:hypothetical protein